MSNYKYISLAEKYTFPLDKEFFIDFTNFSLKCIYLARALTIFLSATHHAHDHQRIYSNKKFQGPRTYHCIPDLNSVLNTIVP